MSASCVLVPSDALIKKLDELIKQLENIRGDTGKKGMSTGVLIAIILGSLVAVVGIVVLIVCLCKPASGDDHDPVGIMRK